MEQQTLKNVNNCVNTNIDSYLETSGGQSYNPYLNVHFFNTSVNWTSVAAQDNCFPALVSNMSCSVRIISRECKAGKKSQILTTFLANNFCQR
jgi:hypothetical protein